MNEITKVSKPVLPTNQPPNKPNRIVRTALKALVPSIINGLIFWLLLSLLVSLPRVTLEIRQVTMIWWLVGIIIFDAIFVFLSRGEKIIGRFFKYLAYEFWAFPIMIIVYVLSPLGQANKSAEAPSTFGVGGSLIIILLAFGLVIGGFGGFILYFIGRDINKRKNKPAV